MQPFITFVIPAYNVANYIEETIESVLNQTDKDFKIVLVDDGSTDGRTASICKRYADFYPDIITAIFQENKGLGGARNSGLEKVDSKYVMFLDSDDFLDLYFLKYLKQLESDFQKRQIDMIFTLPVIYDHLEKNFYDWYDKELFKRIFDGRPYIIPSINTEVYDLEVNACRKIYNVDFLRRLDFKFDEHLKYEDFYPHFYLLTKARNCLGFSCTSFYYRVNRPDQITQLKDASRLDIVKVLSKTLDFILTIPDKRIQISFMKKAVQFTKWCISNSVIDIRKELVEQLYAFFNQVPYKLITEYCKVESNAIDKLYIKLIRKKLFKPFLSDYIYIDIFKNKIRI